MALACACVCHQRTTLWLSCAVLQLSSPPGVQLNTTTMNPLLTWTPQWTSLSRRPPSCCSRWAWHVAAGGHGTSPQALCSTVAGGIPSHPPSRHAQVVQASNEAPLRNAPHFCNCASQIEALSRRVDPRNPALPEAVMKYRPPASAVKKVWHACGARGAVGGLKASSTRALVLRG